MYLFCYLCFHPKNIGFSPKSLPKIPKEFFLKYRTRESGYTSFDKWLDSAYVFRTNPIPILLTDHKHKIATWFANTNHVAIIYLTDCYFNVWIYLHHTANRLSAAVRVKNHCEPVLFSPFQSTFPKTPRSQIHIVIFSLLFPIPVWVRLIQPLLPPIGRIYYRQSAVNKTR